VRGGGAAGAGRYAQVLRAHHCCGLAASEAAAGALLRVRELDMLLGALVELHLREAKPADKERPVAGRARAIIATAHQHQHLARTIAPQADGCGDLSWPGLREGGKYRPCTVAEAQDRLLQLASPRTGGGSLGQGLGSRRSALDNAETAAQVRAALARHQDHYQRQSQDQNARQHERGGRLLMRELVSGLIRAKREATALGRLFARWRRATAATLSATRVLLVYLRMRRAKLLAQAFGRLSRNAAFRSAVVIATRRGATLKPVQRPLRTLPSSPPPPPPLSLPRCPAGPAASLGSLPPPWDNSVLTIARSPKQLHHSRFSIPSSGRSMPWE
jgi:hypothetical protein